MYFETKVTMLVNTGEKVERKAYHDLVDAVSWTDAEAKVTGHYGDSEIKSIVPSKISEVLGGASGQYWKVKVVYLEGESTEKVKKSRVYLLVPGKDETEACDEVRLKFADCAFNWSIEAVGISKIGEVI